jgi:RimJ/RimL family protein N-acetyltransferase
VWELAVARGDRLVGRAGLACKDQGRQAMIWYLLDPAVWGRGYATEAARALVAFAFEGLGVRRVYADVDPRNGASARVCERLGMRREAHFVEDVEVRGEWCDTAIYALLAREWAAVG